LQPFDCSIAEYNNYLFKDTLRTKKDHIALTWLLIDRQNDKIAAYMSLIMTYIILIQVLCNHLRVKNYIKVLKSII